MGQGDSVRPSLMVGPIRQLMRGTVALSGSFTEQVPTNDHSFHWRIVDSLGNLALEATSQAITFTAPDNGTYTATFTVSDANGTGTDDAIITVNNVAPTLTLSGAVEIFAGAPYTLNLQSSDPGADTISQWTIHWGDGITDTVNGKFSAASHVYAVGPADVMITAQATDEDGTYDANAL